MDNNYTSFELISMNAALAERQVTDQILQCNENTEKYGLFLTEQQAFELSQTRTASLKENKRIEFGNGIVDHLFDTPNVYYRSTIVDGINGFFKLYRPQFAAHDIHHLLCGLTQDYPSVPMNLFEYVMLSALGLVLLKRNPQKLNLVSAISNAVEMKTLDKVFLVPVASKQETILM